MAADCHHQHVVGQSPSQTIIADRILAHKGTNHGTRQTTIFIQIRMPDGDIITKWPFFLFGPARRTRTMTTRIACAS